MGPALSQQATLCCWAHCTRAVLEPACADMASFLYAPTQSGRHLSYRLLDTYKLAHHMKRFSGSQPSTFMLLQQIPAHILLCCRCRWSALYTWTVVWIERGTCTRGCSRCRPPSARSPGVGAAAQRPGVLACLTPWAQPHGDLSHNQVRWLSLHCCLQSLLLPVSALEQVPLPSPPCSRLPPGVALALGPPAAPHACQQHCMPEHTAAEPATEAMFERCAGTASIASCPWQTSLLMGRARQYTRCGCEPVLLCVHVSHMFEAVRYECYHWRQRRWR